MPELPEVETVCRGLAPVMEGAVITKAEVRRKNLRFAFPENFSDRLKGQQIIALGRRAKYLLADLSNGETLIMHLGMSGSFRIESDEDALNETMGKAVIKTTHDHVVFHLKTADSKIRAQPARIIYNDPRRFGFMDLIERNTLAEHPFFNKLGIEPLGNELSVSSSAAMFRDKKAPLKAALLDQRLIAGLGNIYVCEALYASGLSPLKPAGKLVGKNGRPSIKLEPLIDNIKDVLRQAIKAGGSSLKDHRQTDGSLGYFQHSFKVYDREGQDCQKPDCQGVIKRIVQSGRSTFYCPSCQK